MSTYIKASKFRQTIEKHKKALGGGLQGPQEAGEALQVGCVRVCVWGGGDLGGGVMASGAAVLKATLYWSVLE